MIYNNCEEQFRSFLSYFFKYLLPSLQLVNIHISEFSEMTSNERKAVRVWRFSEDAGNPRTIKHCYEPAIINEL
jgi:hypothetical protein